MFCAFSVESAVFLTLLLLLSDIISPTVLLFTDILSQKRANINDLKGISDLKYPVCNYSLHKKLNAPTCFKSTVFRVLLKNSSVIEKYTKILKKPEKIIDIILF